MASDEKWYFTKEQLDNTPSRQCCVDAYKELFFRQQAANFIQDMGQRLRVTQLCINTATVYMHRFYVFHSFTQFPWHSIAAAALFLSAKVEEQPRKLEHVIRVHNLCKNPKDNTLDVTSERYQAQSQDLVFNENILLQTLGFDVAIDHPHAHVVRCCHLVRASKDLAQTSYFMASTSLHLTTMCLQYKPTVVACFCIHLACKWSNWQIPLSNEKKEWFSYVDSTVSAELLQQLTEEFLVIFERCPSRLKEKIMALGEGANMCRSTTQTSSPFETEPRKVHPPTDLKDAHHRLHHHEKQAAEEKHRSRQHEGGTAVSQQQREREYREKKERERLVQHSSGKLSVPHPSSSTKQSASLSTHHSNTRPSLDPKLKAYPRPPAAGHSSVPTRNDHRDIIKEVIRDVGVRDSHREYMRPTSEISDNIKEPLRKDIQTTCETKDLEQRVNLKSNVSDSSVPSDHRVNVNSDKRVDARSRPLAPDPKLMQPKHELGRHDQKPLIKSESDIRKNWFDMKNAHTKTQASSSTLKKESPFAVDSIQPISKSNIKCEAQNGSSRNGRYNLPLMEDSLKQEIKEEPGYQASSKKPSMFSPEKSPPKKSVPNKKLVETSFHNIPAPLSPLESFGSRERTKSASSNYEPDLKPVVKKENFVDCLEPINDPLITIKHEILDFESDNQANKELPQTGVSNGDKSPVAENNCIVPLSQHIVNGIETNPTLISNLLKEAPTVPHLPTISNTSLEETPLTESVEKEHHHKDRKKKNKEKHKHKDKDKSKSGEEKEKKKKYKDKDKHKNKNKDKDRKMDSLSHPIKITIAKDKIQPAETPTGGLKIKIPKERLKADVIGESSMQPPCIKIKIPKDVMNNINNESKKRESDRTSSEAPPNKIQKTNYSKQQNGRSSYKVAQLGDGDTPVHRLAESKYINKGASA